MARTRSIQCHCCGESYTTDKPQDPQRDTGYGTCPKCNVRVAESWHKHGFPGDKPMSMSDAFAWLNKYA